MKTKRNVLYADTVLLRIFMCLLAVLPLTIAIAEGVVCLVGGWESIFPGHDALFYLQLDSFSYLPRALAGVGVLLVVGIGIYFAGRKLSAGFQALVAGATALVPRLMLFVLYGKSANPFSDFANAWQLAKGQTESLGHYQFFPAYLNYAVFMRLVARFGDYDYRIVLLSNVILSALTAAGIVLLCSALFPKKPFSLAAGLLFAVNPSSILYSLTSTPEHLCVCATVFGLWLFVAAFRRFQDKALHYTLKEPGLGSKIEGKYSVEGTGFGAQITLVILQLLGAGILGGLGTSMKAFFPIVLVAVVLFLIFWYVARVREDRQRILGEIRPGTEDLRSKALCRKRALILAAFLLGGLLIFAGSEKAAEKGLGLVTGNVFEVTFDDSDALPHFVLVGLNRQAEGQIHLGELSHFYTTLRENGVDRDSAREQAITAFLEDWEGHEAEIPSFLFRKSIWAWQDDYVPVRFFLHAMEIVPEEGLASVLWNYLSEAGAALTQLWYLGLMAACLVAAVLSLVKHHCENPYLFLPGVLIFGYFCLVTIAEAQSRYKVLVLPFLCIFAVAGIGLCCKERVATGKQHGMRANPVDVAEASAGASDAED